MKNPSLVCLALALAPVLVACSEDTRGEGIGRPPSQLPTRPERLALAVTEVFAADGDASSHFVEVHNQADEAIALDGLFVATASATQALSGSLASDARLAVAAPSLALDRTVGEVAVIDAAGFVHAYLAWGGSPATQHTALSGRALASGALAGDDFVPAGYPMPDGLAVHREGDAAGCGTPTPGLAPDATELAAGLVCPVTASAVRLSELMVEDGASVLGSWVEVENPGASPAPVGWMRLCQTGACVTLPPDTELPAGGRLVIYLGHEPPGEPGRISFPAAPRLSPVGEVALYRPGGADRLTSAGLASYMRYGTAESRLAAIAVGVSLWPTAESSTRVPTLAGESMAHNPSGPASTWYAAQPTPGGANLQLDADTDGWTSCSYPRPWREPAPATLFVRAVRRFAETDTAGPRDELVLGYRGAEPLSLAQHVVEVGASRLALEPGRLMASGEDHVIELVASPTGGCAASVNQCWTGAPTLGGSGEVVVGFDSGGGIGWGSFVRWGDGASVHVDDAVSAGRWPLAECALPELLRGTMLELVPGASGHGAGDYVISHP